MDTASEASRSVSVLVRKYPLTYTKEYFLINVCIRNIFMECFPRNNKICRTPGMTLINSQQNAINTIGYTPPVDLTVYRQRQSSVRFIQNKHRKKLQKKFENMLHSSIPYLKPSVKQIILGYTHSHEKYR